MLLLLLLACKDEALIAENAQLKLRNADLERVNGSLEKDNEALKIRLKRQEEEKATEEKKARLERWGLGGPLSAVFRTSKGDIHCTLRGEEAPETVANFVGLARGDKSWTDPESGRPTKRPLYERTIFHRVIPGFMIQGGDPLGTGMGGPGYTFADEIDNRSVFDKPGLLAMANSGPDTNGSQFFITDGTPTHLNGKHTVFGDCRDGEVVRAIAGVERDRSDRPREDVVLKSVEIVTGK